MYQIQIMLSHSILFGILSIGIVIVFLRTIRFEKSHSLHKKSLLTAVHLSSITVISIFLSYLILLTIAWVQLTVMAVMINSNAKSLGIITDKKELVKTLKGNDTPPQIIASDDDSYSKLIAIASTISGTNSFYGNTILPSVPSFLVLPIKELGASILLDNTLIIANVNKKELETLSPIVGYMFIKHYFPQRAIRFYPKIVVIDDKEYESYRFVDSKEKIKTLDSQLATLEKEMSSSAASLSKMKTSIDTNKALIPTTFAQKDDKMKKCNASGHYEKGIFKHDNTPEFCQKDAIAFDTIVDTANKEIDENTKQLPIVQSQLDLYKQYKTFFSSQRKLNAVLDKNIPHELGVYKPPSTIRILIDTKSSHALADYFATSVHEYLHYASHNEKKSFSILFFEEGLTEYFTRKVITNGLNTSTNLGYPIFAKIITQITNAIPESDLEEIYFTKDQARLEKVLNSVYGENFYKNNAILFTTLQYASNPTQILITANAIMKHIGGDPMTSEDIFSTESQL